MSETKQEWRGRLGALTPKELEEFLEQGVNMTLPCLKPNSDPYNTICWYQWRDARQALAGRLMGPAQCDPAAGFPPAVCRSTSTDARRALQAVKPSVTACQAGF